jgi:hypothetical protein
MPDVLIRDVPEEVVAAIDADAGRLGLSRSEYLRRALAQTAGRGCGSVTVDDLRRFGSLYVDLADDNIMHGAWR